MTGMVTPMVLDGPINSDWFEAYVGHDDLAEQLDTSKNLLMVA